MKKTNMEHYRNEILEAVKNKESVGGFAKENGKITTCIGRMQCESCDFDFACAKERTLWLMEDYKPEITLTAREKHFVECVNYGWIARDKDQDLCWYERKPSKNEEDDIWEGAFSDIVDLNSECFKFITWEDDQPWSWEELRKLKVKDE